MAEITRDALLTRRAELAEQEKLAWANLNAVLGAIQDVDHWLAVLETPAEVPDFLQFGGSVSPADIERLRRRLGLDTQMPGSSPVVHPMTGEVIQPGNPNYSPEDLESLRHWRGSESTG